MTNRRRSGASLCAGVLMVLGAQMLFAIGGQAAPYTTGDVLLSMGQFGSGNTVNEYKPDGTLVQTLTTTGGGGGASTFDANGNFFVISGNTVLRFDANGNAAGTFGSGYNTPGSILFDKVGNAYVGQGQWFAHSCVTACPVLKFDSAGNLLASYSPSTEDGGTTWIALGADQCTLFYTSGNQAIKRFNVCTNTQLPDF